MPSSPFSGFVRQRVLQLQPGSSKSYGLKEDPAAGHTGDMWYRSPRPDFAPCRRPSALSPTCLVVARLPVYLRATRALLETLCVFKASKLHPSLLFGSHRARFLRRSFGYPSLCQPGRTPARSSRQARRAYKPSMLCYACGSTQTARSREETLVPSLAVPSRLGCPGAEENINVYTIRAESGASASGWNCQLEYQDDRRLRPRCYRIRTNRGSAPVLFLSPVVQAIYRCLLYGGSEIHKILPA